MSSPCPTCWPILAAGRRWDSSALRADDAKGEIYLEKGRLVHAVCGAAKGKAAVTARSPGFTEIPGSIRTPHPGAAAGQSMWRSPFAKPA